MPPLSNDTQAIICLPDTLRNWPWPRTINPHYLECKTESEAWIKGVRAFSPRAQKAFNRCNFSLLSSLAWANLDRDGCRIGCDLMHLFFVFDEYSDRSTQEESGQQAISIMDALRDPHKLRPEGEFVGGRVAQEFWLNAIKTTPESFQKRFIEAFQRYVDSVVQQSSDRDNHCQRDIASYFALRRYTIGAEPSFVLNAMHMDLPDHVVAHPTLKRLEELATDMIILGNDIVSYDREQSQPGQAEHNIISAIMSSLKLDVQGAMDWVGGYHDGLVDEFLAEFETLPTFPEESQQVNTYVVEYANALANWVRASDAWGFESERYFGKDAPRIGRERTFALRPQQVVSDAFAQEVAIAPEPKTLSSYDHDLSEQESEDEILGAKSKSTEKGQRYPVYSIKLSSIWETTWSFLGSLLRRARIVF
ncbi:terpenoid synthase [Rhypophila sp. PSN 637]